MAKRKGKGKGGAARDRGAGGRRAARIGARVLAAALLLGVAFAVRAPLLRAVGGYLTVEDDVASADLIVVLPSDVTTRPFRAAALYRRGLAPRVVVPRVEDGPAVRMGLMPNPTDVIVGILKREGVPADAITVVGATPATSTADDARSVRSHLLEHPAQRLLLVTSDYHTRRARLAFRRELAGLGVEVLAVGAPHAAFGDRDWWRSEAGLVAYFQEYVKLAYYVVRD